MGNGTGYARIKALKLEAIGSKLFSADRDPHPWVPPPPAHEILAIVT
jgi:hypothetical protein